MNKRIKPVDPASNDTNEVTEGGGLSFLGRLTRRLRRRVGRFLSDRGLKDHVVLVGWTER